MSAAIALGLADPPLDSQRIFRHLLDAFAHPGKRVPLPLAPEAPAPLYRSTAAVALALLDYETPLWLDAASDIVPVQDFLRFHCGAPLVKAIDAARFAIVVSPATMPRLDAFQQGEAAYPDRSATLILQVPAFSGPKVTLKGPGIERSTSLAVDGLPADFWRQWADNHAGFPLGVDLVLATPETVVALPRSIKAEV